VLLIGEAQAQLAFRVERVFSIETSFWTLQGWSGEGQQSEALVQLGLGMNRSAFPVLDLDLIAARFLASATDDTGLF
jgi:hypothetical protein